MAKTLSNQSILARAINEAIASDDRRTAERKEAQHRFDDAILELDNKLSALTTIRPEGDGVWFFVESFRTAIKSCESLASGRQFREAWGKVKELSHELSGCIAFNEEASAEVEPALRVMACKPYNKKVIKRRVQRPMISASTNLGELLKAVLA